MKNLKTRPFAGFLISLFMICFAVMAFISGAEVHDVWSALKTAYKTIPVVLLLWMVFVLYAWKWRVFQNWLVPFPCLDGTWQGSIETTWTDPQTGETPDLVPVIVTIKQSFGRISCVMRTVEMTSRSFLADFHLDSDEQIRKLVYSYTSVPSVTVMERSQSHEGTMVLELMGKPVNKLRGTYWTTRKTTGEVSLTFRCKEHLDEYPIELGAHPMQKG